MNDANRVDTNVVLPPRGIIYDSNGKKLAYNVPAYTLSVNTGELSAVEEEEIIRHLAEYLNLNPDELWLDYLQKVYDVENTRQILSRIAIKKDLNIDQYLSVLPHLDLLPGIYIDVQPLRVYSDSEYFSHVLGYIGAPMQADIDAGVYFKESVGKTGIELQYDELLRGNTGLKITQTSTIGQEQATFVSKDFKYGDNIYLTLDSAWQKALTDIMQTQLRSVNAFASAGVIMNSNTGEIKALVSLPTYDNNKFSQGISSNDYSELINDIHSPLLDRTIGLQLPPGSVFKIVGATTLLEEGIVTDSTIILSDRCLDLPGNIKFCEADSGYLGNINLRTALEKSSNIFFCTAALRLNSQKDGIYSQIKYAEGFGIGKITGIDLPGEQKGTMPSPELKKRLFNTPWYVGDECNTIIGQGLLTVTPMQMLVATAAVNNGGKVLQPHLLSKVEDQVGGELQRVGPKVVNELGVSDNALDIIKRGMRQAAETGTASPLGRLPNNVIAKTGSSDAGEVIQGTLYQGAHSWVVGCFDYEGENYCFTVMQQWGGRGYKTVPIMDKFIKCLNSDFTQYCS